MPVRRSPKIRQSMRPTEYPRYIEDRQGLQMGEKVTSSGRAGTARGRVYKPNPVHPDNQPIPEKPEVTQRYQREAQEAYDAITKGHKVSAPRSNALRIGRGTIKRGRT